MAVTVMLGLRPDPDVGVTSVRADLNGLADIAVRGLFTPVGRLDVGLTEDAVAVERHGTGS